MNPKPVFPEDIGRLAGIANRNAVQSLVKSCLATGLKALPWQLQGPTDVENAEKILAGDRSAALLVRAPIAPTTLSGTQALTQIAYAFVEALIPVSASAALIARSLQLQFDEHAEVRVPELTVPRATFISEGEAIPVQAGASGISAILDPFKLALIIQLSGEVMRSTNAEALVRAALLASVGASLDEKILSTAAGIPLGTLGARPPGILFGVTPLTAATGGGLAAQVSDIANLADALKNLAGNGQICLVAAPKQAVALAMLPPSGSLPWPVFTSAALATGTVVAVATQALVTIIAAPKIEARNALAVQENTLPSGDLMTGGAVRSTFQTDAVGIRFILPCSWTVRGAGVAFIQNTTW